MVIFYDLTTKDILYTERDTILPQLPNGTTEEQLDILGKDNVGFVCVPYEMDLEIFNYKVCFDLDNKFTGIQPVGGAS